MFDDLRQQANETFIEDSQTEEPPPEPTASSGRFLGMTPSQRFLIAAMLLAIALLLSTFCLLVTEKVVPPFLY